MYTTDIFIDGQVIDVKTQKWYREYNTSFNKKDISSIQFGIRPAEWYKLDYVRIVIMLLCIPITYGTSLLGLGLFIKFMCTQHVIITLNDKRKVMIPICQKGDASDFLRELNYDESELKKNDNRKVSFKSWSIREWVITIIWLIVAASMIGAGADLWMKNHEENSEPEIIESSAEEEKSVDLVDIDMKTVIGKTKEDIEKLGFSKDDSGDMYYNGDTSVGFDKNGKVNMIMIEGNPENAPTFAGIKLGMTLEEVDEILPDQYQKDGEIEDKVSFVDYNTGDTVLVETENNFVKSIFYMQLSDEEMQDAQSAMYIFPDSDKKYLSEEEIRSVEADKLRIGRNEIYARHGRIFDSADLNEYFSAQPWYNGTIPADEFDSKVTLNDFEKKNAELIKKVEDEVNGTSNKPISFIGTSGCYICGSDEDSGMIDVYVNGSTFNMALGTQENPDIYGGVGGGMPGKIVDSNTAVVDWGDCIYTLKWSEKGVFTITREGSLGDYEIDSVTDGMEYVNIDFYGGVS
ncbi:YARHG domain-containing protein [[Clostridium] scindens]|uniref:YARHG domain-containing protein n=1 Tax=Clostridium scindens (strain JCM 10418 / VPI 12708) TaxID=29347 RepID=UPI002676D4DB|nr:YARHG domain-containing protein [[Clostridium] scindens]